MVKKSILYIAGLAILTISAWAGPVAGGVCESGTGAEFAALGAAGCTIDGRLRTFVNSDYSLWDSVTITPLNDGLGGYSMSLAGSILYTHNANQDPFSFDFGFVTNHDVPLEWTESISATFPAIGSDFLQIYLLGTTFFGDDPSLPGTLSVNDVPFTRVGPTVVTRGSSVFDSQGSGSYTLTNYTFAFTPAAPGAIPEPSTFALIIPGLAALAWRRFRR